MLKEEITPNNILYMDEISVLIPVVFFIHLFPSHQLTVSSSCALCLYRSLCPCIMGSSESAAATLPGSAAGVSLSFTASATNSLLCDGSPWKQFTKYSGIQTYSSHIGGHYPDFPLIFFQKENFLYPQILLSLPVVKKRKMIKCGE